MKRGAALVLALVFGLSLMINTSFSVSAETTTETTTVTTIDEVVSASNLLTSYMFSGSSSANKLYLSGTIHAIETMAKIGFTDFEIQRSSNGTGNWMSTSYSVSDQIKTNAISHSLAQYPVSVTGGYYYRVSFNFYAKEKGWFFPKTQSVSYTSSAIWVPTS